MFKLNAELAYFLMDWFIYLTGLIKDRIKKKSGFRKKIILI